MVSTFSLIYLFQSLDKTCKRKSVFDKIKNPLISSCIIGLISTMIYEENSSVNNFSNIFSIPLYSKDLINNLNKQSVFTDLGNF